MIARIVQWSADHPRAIAVSMLALALVGEIGRRRLARDAIPDLSDPQVVLIAEWMGHPATQVATEVTNVLAAAIDGTAGSTAIRGSSMSGMAFLDVVFDGSANLAAGRAEIAARVDEARPRLPAGVRIQVGPEASSTGWVLEYLLADPTRRQEPVTLRRLQDEVLRPSLSAIPGVAEVASLGGAVEQISVEAMPDRLRANGRAFSDLVDALAAAAAPGRVPTVADIEALSLPGAGDASGLAVRDVARVRSTADMPNGIADYNGTLRAVGGIVVARRDADVLAVVRQVEEALDRERRKLPAGLKLITVHSRADLAVRVEQTLVRALTEEVIAVVLVILIFLMHWRSAVVPLATLILVLLATFAGMWLLRIPATVMSLGGIAIALGMAIDAEVVALEACHRSIEAGGPDGRARTIAAAGSFAPALLTSLVIAALAFLPVFGFSGESGRLLRPLALTKTLVIVSAAVVTLTAAPALRDRLLRGKVVPEMANPLTRGLVRIYRPMVHFALFHPALTLVTAALAVASCLPLVSRLGGEFLPRLDEGDLLFMPTTLAGIPPDEAEMVLARQDRAIARHEEVAAVMGKVGRADTATDPAPFSMAETIVALHPRSEWPLQPRSRWYSSWAPGPLRSLFGLIWPEQTPRTTEELVSRLNRDTAFPGWTNAWTAPARARMDMMATGVRTPVGVRVVAGSPERLDAIGAGVRSVIARVPGTGNVVSDARGGEIWPTFVVDTEALARHGVDGARVRAIAQLALSGGRLPDTGDGNRPVRLRVLGDTMSRRAAEQVGELTVRSRDDLVPLGLLGRVAFSMVPEMVRSERGRLVAYSYIDLSEGTNLATYVQRARQEVSRAAAAGELALRPDERIEWTGQYELLAAGQRRLAFIVPIVLLSMLGLLYLQFRSVAEALIVLVSVPFALVGSIWILFLLRYPMSAPVWVGLLSVVGLAMQTGVVMVVYIDAAFFRRLRAGQILTRDDIVAAHAEGTVRRLRPKMMTITTMAAGLMPLLWSDGAGAEIMKRVAAPMVGGLATSAVLTLEVLPVLYTIWRSRQLARAQRSGKPLSEVVGPPPRWAI